MYNINREIILASSGFAVANIITFCLKFQPYSLPLFVLKTSISLQK